MFLEQIYKIVNYLFISLICFFLVSLVSLVSLVDLVDLIYSIRHWVVESMFKPKDESRDLGGQIFILDLISSISSISFVWSIWCNIFDRILKCGNDRVAECLIAFLLSADFIEFAQVLNTNRNVIHGLKYYLKFLH